MPVARAAGCTALQTRNASASSFDSPFKGSPDSTKIPAFVPPLLSWLPLKSVDCTEDEGEGTAT
jgi:hypothetical protein